MTILAYNNPKEICSQTALHFSTLLKIADTLPWKYEKGEPDLDPIAADMEHAQNLCYFGEKSHISHFLQGIVKTKDILRL